MPPHQAENEQTLVNRAMATLVALEETVRADNYAGWDPFDGLNSKLLRFTPLAYNGLTRLAWLQLFKRSPINMRSLTAVPKVHNAKALALFARASNLRGQRSEELRLVEQMLSMRSDEQLWGKGAWGYPFDWQAKAFYVPEGVPNVICTTYAVRALLARHHTSDEDYSDIITAAAEFVATCLVCHRKGRGRYIGYIPASSAMVHNASLWGCYILLLGHSITDNEDWLTLAEEAIDYTLHAQRDDGAWIYGEAPHHQFVDGFHTGYNLEALHLIRGLRPSLDKRIAPAIKKGLDYYTNYLFEDDGTPRYYDTKRWPLDCHSAAQAILTLIIVDPTPERKALAERVLNWSLEHMWQPDKRTFIYQRHPWYANRIPYIRWTQAWMYLALSTWLAHERGE